ncbi:lipoprotein [Patiriisocius marinus]|uniref:Lipoprotein n=1 Tax=Patiriisocius marinus TaxID=1397112 RepID=A0A5J4INC5_9FLAO|nr:hypothetical protein [Patiriisocius marinus]GER58849.1 lipoprotein [Patiriisocius marinus]
MNIPLPKFLSIAFLSLTTIITSCGSDDNEAQTSNPTDFEGTVSYVKTFGGSGVDIAVDIVEANNGNYVIVGTTTSTDGDISGKTTSDQDYWMLEITPEGSMVSNQTYGGSQDDVVSSVSKTSDGGYIMSGYSRSTDGDVSENAGFQDFWLVKTNSTGTIQWEQSFGFLGTDQAFNVFETSTGNFFATGFLDVTASGGEGNDATTSGNDDTRGVLHGVGEFWGILMDSNGNKLWRRYFGGSNNDRSYDAIETNDGGFLMTGASESVDFDITDDKGSYDFWAVRLDVNGNKLWTKSFGGSEIDISYAVAKTTDNGYILVGDTRSSDKDVSNLYGNADVWAVKFNDDGAIVWEQNYGGASFDSARDIKKLNNGDFAIVGNSRSGSGDYTNNYGQNDIMLMTIGANGNLKYSYTAGGSGLDFGDALIQTQDNSIVLVGNTESNDNDITTNRGIKDVVVIKIK